MKLEKKEKVGVIKTNWRLFVRFKKEKKSHFSDFHFQTNKKQNKKQLEVKKTGATVSSLNVQPGKTSAKT